MSESKSKGKSSKKDGKSKSTVRSSSAASLANSPQEAGMSPLLGRAKNRPVVAQLSPDELREIQRLLDMIPKRFHDPEFNVLKEVVEMLTSKDKKKRMARIEKECAMLDKAMQTFVDVHYEGFIQSINSYTHILKAVSLNKKEVSNLKHVIRKCRDLLVQRSTTHLPALWSVRSQCTEMIGLLDCIAWLKRVPGLLATYLQGEGIVAYAAAKGEKASARLLPKASDVRVATGVGLAALGRQDRGPHYLHASLLLLSAATLLTAKRPQLEETKEEGDVFVVKDTARYLDPDAVPDDADQSPLARIPALRHLRESIVAKYCELHESLLKELRHTVYNHEATKAPDGEEKVWPSVASIYGYEEEETKAIDEGAAGEYLPLVEKVTEKLDVDYREDVPTYIALLTEALVGLGRLEETAAYVASKAIVEFRTVMSERLAWVTGGVEDGSLEVEGTEGVLQEARALLEAATAAHLAASAEGGDTAGLEELFAKDRSDSTERVLVVFLESVFGRFLDTLKKQLFLSLLLKHRKREEETVEVEAGKERVARVYRYWADGAAASGRVQFRPSEMWELIQMEVINFLRVQLQGGGGEEEDESGFEAPQPEREEAGQAEARQGAAVAFTAFRFANSSAFIHADVEDHDDVASLFSTSPYNVVRAYLPVLQFNTAAVSLLPTEENTSWTLKEFLEQFITTKFMHRLRQDFAEKISEAVSAEGRWHVMYPQTSAVGLSSTRIPVLQCADATLGLLTTLFDYILALPNISSSLMDVVMATIGRFLQTASAKVYGILNGTLTGQMLDDDKAEEILLTDPRLQPVLQSQSFSPPDSVELNDARFEKASAELEERYHDSEFLEGNVVEDMKCLRLLAHVNSSLDWMLLYVELLSTKVDDFIAAKHGTDPLVFQQPSNTWQHIQPMARELERLSRKCLFALRFELRLRSARSVGRMGECLYVLQERNEQPDPFVYAMVESLAAAEVTLAPALTEAKLEYVFGGLAALISSEIVFSLRRLDGINGNGILKVRKNVFALQQLLPSAVVRNQEGLFDRVRIYYELLKLQPSEVLAHAQNSLAQYDTFSMDEYEELAKKLCCFHVHEEGVSRRKQQKAAKANTAQLIASIRDVLASVQK